MMMPPRIVFVAGTSFSGSTFLDLVLSNAEQAFSCGELCFLFHPEQPHHYHPRCACGDPSCDLWNRVRDAGKSKAYAAISAELPELGFIVDSSKDALWIRDQIRTTSEAGFGSQVVLIWKTPYEIAQSFQRRGRLDGWVKSWRNYHQLLFSCLSEPPVAIRYRNFTESDQSLDALCRKLGMPVAPGRRAYWEKTHHTLFGNRSARKHLNEIEAALGNPSSAQRELKSASYSEEISEEVRRHVDNALASSEELRRLNAFLEAVSDAMIGAAELTDMMKRCAMPAIEREARYVLQPVRRLQRRLRTKPAA